MHVVDKLQSQKRQPADGDDVALVILTQVNGEDPRWVLAGRVVVTCGGHIKARYPAYTVRQWSGASANCIETKKLD